MTDRTAQDRRHFTEAARAAAQAARAAKRELPSRFGVPELFVVRAASADMPFTWEIRQHGGVLLQKGSRRLASVALARSEGELALAGFGVPL